MECANHVWDVHVGHVTDDEGQDWLVTACKCGARTAILFVDGKASEGNGRMPDVVYGALHDQPRDGLLQKCYNGAEKALDSEK